MVAASRSQRCGVARPALGGMEATLRERFQPPQGRQMARAALAAIKQGRRAGLRVRVRVPGAARSACAGMSDVDQVFAVPGRPASVGASAKCCAPPTPRSRPRSSDADARGEYAGWRQAQRSAAKSAARRPAFGARFQPMAMARALATTRRSRRSSRRFVRSRRTATTSRGRGGVRGRGIAGSGNRGPGVRGEGVAALRAAAVRPAAETGMRLSPRGTPAVSTTEGRCFNCKRHGHPISRLCASRSTSASSLASGVAGEAERRRRGSGHVGKSSPARNCVALLLSNAFAELAGQDEEKTSRRTRRRGCRRTTMARRALASGRGRRGRRRWRLAYAASGFRPNRICWGRRRHPSWRRRRTTRRRRRSRFSGHACGRGGGSSW